MRRDPGAALIRDEEAPQPSPPPMLQERFGDGTVRFGSSCANPATPPALLENVEDCLRPYNRRQ
ncbi:MAG: hypothetical protein ACLSDQ_00690 [Adlercreutzia equolifaciens]